MKILENENLKRIFGDIGKREIKEGIKLHVTEVHKSNFG